MEPFEGSCETPEQKVERGVITVSAKRSGYGCRDVEDDATLTSEGNPSQCSFILAQRIKPSSRLLMVILIIRIYTHFCVIWLAGDSDENFDQTKKGSRQALKRIRKGVSRACKKAV